MRFAVISDVHSNLHALLAVLSDIDDRGIESLYCLGDTVGYAAMPNEVLNELRCRQIPTLQGNYDESVGEELFTCGCDFPDENSARLGEISNNWTIDNTSEDNKQWLAALPKEIRLEAGGLSVLMAHGSPRKNNEYLHRHLSDDTLLEASAGAEFDVLITGHTHVPYHRTISGKHFLNPGSVGKPKHGNENAVYGIVAVKDRKVTLSVIEVAYDVEAAVKSIIAVGLPGEFAEALRPR